MGVALAGFQNKKSIASLANLRGTAMKRSRDESQAQPNAEEEVGNQKSKPPKLGPLLVKKKIGSSRQIRQMLKKQRICVQIISEQ